MVRAACSAEGESWKRSACWTGQSAGKTKRSTEKVRAPRNRDRQFLVRMLTILCRLLDKFAFCLTQPMLETGAGHSPSPRCRASIG